MKTKHFLNPLTISVFSILFFSSYNSHQSNAHLTSASLQGPARFIASEEKVDKKDRLKEQYAKAIKEETKKKAEHEEEEKKLKELKEQIVKDLKAQNVDKKESDITVSYLEDLKKDEEEKVKDLDKEITELTTSKTTPLDCAGNAAVTPTPDPRIVALCTAVDVKIADKNVEKKKSEDLIVIAAKFDDIKKAEEKIKELDEAHIKAKETAEALLETMNTRDDNQLERETYQYAIQTKDESTQFAQAAFFQVADMFNRNLDYNERMLNMIHGWNNSGRDCMYYSYTIYDHRCRGSQNSFAGQFGQQNSLDMYAPTQMNYNNFGQNVFMGNQNFDKPSSGKWYENDFFEVPAPSIYDA